MGKIVYIMGKSASGKDSVFERIRERFPDARVLVPYTTRPLREGEENGREYVFTTEEAFLKLREAGSVIESRVYDTCYGPWRYFTVADGIEPSRFTYLSIGTPASFLRLKERFGKDRMLPVMIELDDGERLQRALDREKKQDEPKYAELCRRFLSDEQDFSEERLAEAGIGKDARFCNDELDACAEAVCAYIGRNLQKAGDS